MFACLLAPDVRHTMLWKRRSSQFSRVESHRVAADARAIAVAALARKERVIGERAFLFDC